MSAQFAEPFIFEWCDHQNIGIAASDFWQLPDTGNSDASYLFEGNYIPKSHCPG